MDFRIVCLCLLLFHSLNALKTQDEAEAEPRSYPLEGTWMKSFNILTGLFNWLSNPPITEKATNDVDRQDDVINTNEVRDSDDVIKSNDVNGTDDVSDYFGKTRAYQIAPKIVDPIKTFVNQASSAARNIFTGLKDRISTTMTSFTDYIVNIIPYAKESSKIPNQHLPEYAVGEPVPRFSEDKLQERSGEAESRQVEGERSPEALYQDFVDRLEGKAQYNTYYNLKDMDEQYIKDYEQLVENKKAAKKYKNDPINVLVSLYRKLEAMIRQDENKRL